MIRRLERVFLLMGWFGSFIILFLIAASCDDEEIYCSYATFVVCVDKTRVILFASFCGKMTRRKENISVECLNIKTKWLSKKNNKYLDSKCTFLCKLHKFKFELFSKE